MSTEPDTAVHVQALLRKLFHDDTILYDHAQFAGGMTNYNYIANIHGVSYIVREPGFKTDQIIDRAAEQKNNRIASELGINSECIYFNSGSGIKISRMIPHAQTFTAINPASEDAMVAAASLLRKIHGNATPFSNRFDWRAELSKYESIVRSLNCSFFSDYTQRRDQLSAFVAEHISSFRSVPCHNDTVPENFLMKRGRRGAYLIDWEYSGMNDPAWDVAMYIGEACLPEDAIQKMLTYYYGTYSIDPVETMKLKCLVMAQDLLWSVWAMIRHYSGEDFLDYLYNRYNRFRRNLTHLMLDSAYSLADMVKL